MLVMLVMCLSICLPGKKNTIRIAWLPTPLKLIWGTLTSENLACVRLQLVGAPTWYTGLRGNVSLESHRGTHEGDMVCVGGTGRMSEPQPRPYSAVSQSSDLSGPHFPIFKIEMSQEVISIISTTSDTPWKTGGLCSWFLFHLWSRFCF